MNGKYYLALITCFLLHGQLYAEQRVIGDDGRQIILSDDGSWAYSSSDRFATTAEGKRVRLKDDGSWAYTGQKAVQSEEVFVTKKLAATQSVEMKISKLVIESSRENLPAKIKSKNTQSVFYITLKRQHVSTNQTPIALQLTDFSVRDDDDNEYAVVGVTPAKVLLKSGSEIQIMLRANGSPKWWKAKSMSVILDKKSLASPVDITASYRLSKAEKASVKSFQ